MFLKDVSYAHHDQIY